MTGQDSAEIPPSCILGENIQVKLEFDLLDRESCRKLPKSILGTQGQDALANLS